MPKSTCSSWLLPLLAQLLLLSASEELSRAVAAVSFVPSEPAETCARSLESVHLPLLVLSGSNCPERTW